MYSLQRDLGVWRLVYQDQVAILKHETGLPYVNYLLTHPGPIHGLDLFLAVRSISLPRPPGRPTRSPATSGRIQERSLAFDDAEAARRLLRQRQVLEAILDDPLQTEPVKAEALQELQAIETYGNLWKRHTEDAAQKTVRTVRRAIGRLHKHLILASDASGRPHPVLRAFGEHLGRCLIAPSAKTTPPGSFIYEPPGRWRWRLT